MSIQIDFSECGIGELLNIHAEILGLIKECCGSDGYIFKANNGKIYPKVCEACDGPVRIVCNRLNFTEREIEAVKNSSEFGENPWVRWYNFLGRLIKGGRFEMPVGAYPFPPAEVNGAGDWYCAHCSCKIGGWKKTYDEAIEDWWGLKLIQCP